MKKKMLKIATVICFMLCVLFLGQVTVFAATIGSSLAGPESGWRRYDDLNPYFYYEGSWGSTDNGSRAFYNGEVKYTSLDVNEGTVKFKFRGSKLRIITQIYNSRSERIEVKIDDEISGEYSLYNSKLQTDQCLDYEKENLEFGVHYVELKNLDTAKRFLFDAIDIDSTGELLPYDKAENSNLKATAGDSKVDLTWNPVTDATSYTVKRSTAAGGPYTTIAAGVTGTTYTDTGVTNGTTYYYVVTAIVNGSEGWNSNEASATPQASTDPNQPIKNKVLLVITMVTGERKEYEMTADKINDFIAWYNSKAASSPTYVIEKDYNKASFTSRKDYIAYEQISNFEVNEYND